MDLTFDLDEDASVVRHAKYQERREFSILEHSQCRSKLVFIFQTIDWYLIVGLKQPCPCL